MRFQTLSVLRDHHLWRLQSDSCQHYSVRHSVMSSSLRPHGLQLARLLCPLDAPGMEGGAMPFSRDLPCPGIKPRSPTFQADSLQFDLPGKSSRCQIFFASFLTSLRAHWLTFVGLQITSDGDILGLLIGHVVFYFSKSKYIWIYFHLIIGVHVLNPYLMRNRMLQGGFED